MGLRGRGGSVITRRHEHADHRGGESKRRGGKNNHRRQPRGVPGGTWETDVARGFGSAGQRHQRLGLAETGRRQRVPSVAGPGKVRAGGIDPARGYENLEVLPSEVDLAVAEVDVARSENYLQRLRLALAPIVAGSGTAPAAETQSSAAGTVAPADSAAQAVLPAKGCYDFILVDCPPSLGILTMNALVAADTVLVPIQCEYFALEGLAVISRVIQQIRASGANPGLELAGIVMTMYDGRTNLAQQVVSEVRGHFGNKVFQSVIPRTVRLAEAPSFGKPITAYDSGSLAARAYRDLAEELLAVISPPAAPAPVAA